MSAYERVARNLSAADEQGRAIMLGFARGGDAMTGLAIFCAAEGYSREAAAEAIGCRPEDLDTAIETFAASISAERRRRERERAA